MGCSISRLELRGCGMRPGLPSLRHKIEDDASRSERAILTNHYSDSEKLLVQDSVGRNSVAGEEEKDAVLGGPKELRISQQESLREPSYHAPKEHRKPPLIDGFGATYILDSGKTEIREVEVKQTKSTNHVENDEDLDQGGAVIPNFDGPLWIASPSFRVYCAADCDSEDDGFKGIAAIAKGNKDPENRIDRQNQNLAHDGEVTHDDNAIIKQDESRGKSVRRKRNLRKVLTMHRPAAVRNLFSVTTCYNPIVPSPNNGPRKSHRRTV